MKQYAARESERSKLTKSLFHQNNKLTYINAYKASGITSFITDFINSKLTEHEAIKSLMIDACNLEPLTKEITRCIFADDSDNDIQSYMDRHFGKKSSSYKQALAEEIPLIGRLIGVSIEKKEGPLIEELLHESIFEEILIPFFKDYFNKSADHRIILFIDNAQHIQERDIPFLKKILLIRKANVVLMWTSESTSDKDKQIKISNFLEQIDPTRVQIDFCQPDLKLVMELAEIYDLEIDSLAAKTIIHTNKQSIHRILNSIKELKDPQKGEELTIMQKDIMNILATCKMKLKSNYLYEIVQLLPNSINFSQSEFEKAIYQLLEDNKIAEIHDGLNYRCLSLIVANHEALEIDFSDKLIYQNTIYTYLQGLNNPDFDLLLYELTDILGINTNELYAKKVFLTELRTRKNISKEYFEKANLSTHSEEDCLYAAIYYCKKRNYITALEYLERIEENQDKKYFVLRGTLLSRCKRQSEAITALKKCIRETDELDLLCLLYSYLIPTYIHSNKVEEAKETFKEIETTMEKSKNYGYLLRNSMTICSSRLKIYDKALESLSYHENTFGFYTTLGNKGRELCQQQQYEDSQAALKEAAQKLEEYGNEHLHVVYNNLGISYIFMEDFKSARKYLSLAEVFSNESMPKLFSKINQAWVMLISGDHAKGLQELINIEPEVKEHPIDRVRQKYYRARLFSEHLNQTSQCKKYEELCLAHPDRMYPKETLQSIEALKKEEFSNLDFEKRTTYFDPCYLAYWYVDPLQLFTESI